MADMMEGKKMKKSRLRMAAGCLALFLTAALALSGCAGTGQQSRTGTGAAVGAAAGAALGALAGQIAGGDTESTLKGAAIGAGVGAAAGAGVGYMLDQQEKEYKAALAQSEAAAVRREQEILAVVLKGDLTFATDSWTVKPGLVDEIERIAQIMNRYPASTAMVEGHTDSVGKEAYNLELSKKRARAVADLLVQKGVAPHRIRSGGYGETLPVADNTTPEGRRLNRRVEIKIDPGQEAAQG